MKKIDKTNAMRILDQQHIEYEVKTYDVSDGHIDGASVAKKAGLDPDCVFKTLVTKGNDKNHYVFVIPVLDELDLKKCAKAVNVKNVEMVAVKDLLNLTGYIRGGCSPVGMKKLFKTVFDEKIILQEKIHVSGGKQGLQIYVNSEDLISITNGIIEDITR